MNSRNLEFAVLPVIVLIAFLGMCRGNLVAMGLEEVPDSPLVGAVERMNEELSATGATFLVDCYQLDYDNHDQGHLDKKDAVMLFALLDIHPTVDEVAVIDFERFYDDLLDRVMEHSSLQDQPAHLNTLKKLFIQGKQADEWKVFTVEFRDMEIDEFLAVHLPTGLLTYVELGH